NYEQAAQTWERGRQATPDNPLILRNLAAAYHMLDRIEEAASAIQRALEVRPTGPLYSNLG
ncbi:MAG TPA: hypothetical protein DEH78_05395, partial [Solibacterales bacterium]|nr:hypothetical protein [Bryobacterales bacterium]